MSKYSGCFHVEMFCDLIHSGSHNIDLHEILNKVEDVPLFFCESLHCDIPAFHFTGTVFLSNRSSVPPGHFPFPGTANRSSAVKIHTLHSHPEDFLMHGGMFFPGFFSAGEIFDS